MQVLDSQGAPVAGMLVYPSRIEMPNGPFLANERTGVVSPIPDEILESLAVRTDKDGIAILIIFLTGVWTDFDVEASSTVSKNSRERNPVT